MDKLNFKNPKKTQREKVWYELICLGRQVDDNSHILQEEPWVLLLLLCGRELLSSAEVPWVHARGCVPVGATRGSVLVNS